MNRERRPTSKFLLIENTFGACILMPFRPEANFPALGKPVGQVASPWNHKPPPDQPRPGLVVSDGRASVLFGCQSACAPEIAVPPSNTVGCTSWTRALHPHCSYSRPDQSRMRFASAPPRLNRKRLPQRGFQPAGRDSPPLQLYRRSSDPHVVEDYACADQDPQQSLRRRDDVYIRTSAMKHNPTEACRAVPPDAVRATITISVGLLRPPFGPFDERGHR
jgi:hypothetical protein